MVLVCPDCQVEGWTDGLDACAGCGSTRLVKQLGAVVCRDCGAELRADDRGTAATVAPAAPETDPDLADEVAAALARVLGRDPG